ncbi:MAG: transposase [Bacteroidia bacterium]
MLIDQCFAVIEATFPRATVQQCIVHKIRSSTRLFLDRDRKAVCSDLRLIYSAASVEDAERALKLLKAVGTRSTPGWPKPGVGLA